MSGMSLKEYRPSFFSRSALVASGVVVAALGAAIMYPWGRLDYSITMGVVFGFFPFVLGLLLIGRGFQASRGEVSLVAEGLSVEGGDVVPWGSIATIEQMRSLTGLVLRDAAGRELARLSAGLGGYSELAGGILRALATRRSPSTTTFAGRTSREMWWFALFPLLYGVTELATRPNLTSVAILVGLLLLYWKFKFFWKESGTTRLTIDRDGIRTVSRAGDRVIRWGEIEAILVGASEHGAIALQFLKTDDDFVTVPLVGMDQIGVAAALHAYAGALWPRVLVSARQLHDADESLPGTRAKLGA